MQAGDDVERLRNKVVQIGGDLSPHLSSSSLSQLPSTNSDKTIKPDFPSSVSERQSSMQSIALLGGTVVVSVLEILSEPTRMLTSV